MLLRHGAEVNATNSAGATPLLYGPHHTGIVRALLAHGADPNIASALGSTPLMAAAARGDAPKVCDPGPSLRFSPRYQFAGVQPCKQGVLETEIKCLS